MNMGEIKEILCDWASGIPCITHLYIFGSRARKNYGAESDLDIAVKLEPMKGDADSLATYISESDKWKKQLEERLPYVIDLQYHDLDETPTIEDGLKKSSILVFRSF